MAIKPFALRRITKLCFYSIERRHKYINARSSNNLQLNTDLFVNFRTSNYLFSNYLRYFKILCRQEKLISSKHSV